MRGPPGSWAHPRSRGENRLVWSQVERKLGASPLTRGKPKTGATLDGIGGRIPAHAGKTFLGDGGGDTAPAHPRSRGENSGETGRAGSDPGASPLTRGKRILPTDVHLIGGRIPAHAGKTPTSSPRSGRKWAHPRSRGENPTQRRRDHVVRGASPLTRGKRSRPITF